MSRWGGGYEEKKMVANRGARIVTGADGIASAGI